MSLEKGERGRLWFLLRWNRSKNPAIICARLAAFPTGLSYLDSDGAATLSLQLAASFWQLLLQPGCHGSRISHPENALTMVLGFPASNFPYFYPHSTASTWFLTAPSLPSTENLPAPKSLAQFELQFCLILLRAGNGCFDVWYLWTWKALFPLTVHWAGQCLSLLIKNVIKDLTSRKKCIKKTKRCSTFL